jgi:hypothetical protein
MKHPASTRSGCARLALMTLATALLVQFVHVDASGDTRLEPRAMLSGDTLYLRDSLYIEVDRSRQLVVQHFASGRADTHACSTGDIRRRRAIETRLGVYRIEAKQRWHRSTIFNVMMGYWMPFNRGTGFHSLRDTSYYSKLGVAPSSAGCVRLSNASAASLFASTPIGTIVHVHDGSRRLVIVWVGQPVSHDSRSS